MAEVQNGRTVILGIFGTIMVGGLLALGSCIWERQETLRTLFDVHGQLPGHAVVMQKMLTVETTLDDLRKDIREVKDLLRTKP